MFGSSVGVVVSWTSLLVELVTEYSGVMNCDLIVVSDVVVSVWFEGVWVVVVVWWENWVAFWRIWWMPSSRRLILRRIVWLLLLLVGLLGFWVMSWRLSSIWVTLLSRASSFAAFGLSPSFVDVVVAAVLS